MQIVRLMGGFANQMRQYVYGRYLEYRTGEQVCYDDSWFFWNRIHNGYELQRVYGLNLAMASQYFPKVIYQHFIKNSKQICQALYDAGVDIEVVSNVAPNEINFLGPIIKFDKTTAFNNTNISRYHWTYALEFGEYYKEIKNIIDREFVFPPIPNMQLNVLAQEIKNCNSIGIHIRLGDFEKVGWLSSPDYYKRCIEWAEENIHPDKYYIFSDDQDYCQKHLLEYGFNLVNGKLMFVDGNRGDYDYIDFQLMTLCKHLVVSYCSSFSECACVFNKNLKSKITWNSIGMEPKDFFGWKREG